jgi:hypothetical protein
MKKSTQPKPQVQAKAQPAPAINGLRVGDSVKVKPGYLDDDFDIDIGGWQGRITEILDDGEMITVAWDATTLRNAQNEYIARCEEEGYGWEEYHIGATDVELTSQRDSKADVRKVVTTLRKEFYWHGMGPEGEAIRQVLAGIDPDDEWEQMDRWGEYLEEILTFPFEAEVTEFQERSPLHSGDMVRVHGITDTDEHYGVIVNLRHGRKRYDFPLCDLTPTDQKSSNYDPVRTYAIWFANR